MCGIRNYNCFKATENSIFGNISTICCHLCRVCYFLSFLLPVFIFRFFFILFLGKEFMLQYVCNGALLSSFGHGIFGLAACQQPKEMKFTLHPLSQDRNRRICVFDKKPQKKLHTKCMSKRERERKKNEMGNCTPSLASRKKRHQQHTDRN